MKNKRALKYLVYSTSCPTSIIEYLSNISVNCTILVKALILLVFSYKINTSLKCSKKKRKKNIKLANTSGYMLLTDETWARTWWFSFFLLENFDLRLQVHGVFLPGNLSSIVVEFIMRPSNVISWEKEKGVIWGDWQWTQGSLMWISGLWWIL